MRSSPNNIDVLIKKAAVDGAFREVLLERRDACAGEIGLALSAAEAALLRAVSREHLAKMIRATKVPESAVPALLGKAAVLMIAALGVSNEAMGQTSSLGVRPDVPPPPPKTVPPKVVPRPPATKPAPTPVAPKPIATAPAEKKEEWGDYRVTFKDGRQIRCNYEDGGDHYTLVFQTSRRWVDKADVVKIEAVAGAETKPAPSTQAGTQTQPATQTEPATAPVPQRRPEVVAGIMPS